jgi:flagellar basal-body rod protein FlgC
MPINSMRISGSALHAERVRLDTISQNIANVQTTRGTDGRAYRRRQVVFETIPDSPATGGVNVAETVEADTPGDRVYNPGHPDADAQGFVEMPNVSLAEEMVDMIAATRAYEANVGAITATKTLVARAIEIGRT